MVEELKSEGIPCSPPTARILIAFEGGNRSRGTPNGSGTPCCGTPCSGTSHSGTPQSGMPCSGTLRSGTPCSETLRSALRENNNAAELILDQLDDSTTGNLVLICLWIFTTLFCCHSITHSYTSLENSDLYIYHASHLNCLYSHVQVEICRHTYITQTQFDAVGWGDSWQASEDLAATVFRRDTMAIHTLTGSRSNANKNKSDTEVAKPALDPIKLQEIFGVLLFIQVFLYCRVVVLMSKT